MTTITHITEVMAYVEGLQAVIFDLDDTLYSEKEYVRSGYRAIAEHFPMVERMEEKLWAAFQEKKPAIDEVLSSEGLFTEETKQLCLSVYRSHEPDIHFYEGARELLLELRSRGYRIGIITDGRPEGQRAKIRALHLEELVDHIIVTDELGGVAYRKPNSAAFVRMKGSLGIAYDRMCYVGDNIQKDFIAPEALGMRCIWVRTRDGIYQ